MGPLMRVLLGTALLGWLWPAAGAKLTFCIADFSPVPLAICNNATATHPANFTGHDVELLRTAALRMGLAEGSDYDFKCVSFGYLISSLLEPGSPCSAAAAGITITSEREAQGIQFTYPTMKSSLGVLVQSKQQTSNGWGFVKPFSWSLWLALFLTLIAFPPLILTIEFLSLRKSIAREDILPGVGESGWRTALTLMLFDSVNVTSLGARVAVLTFCFLALLTTSTYTANLAAFVTVNTITSRINSVEDLRGRAVGTSPIYVSRLQKYGIQAIPYPFNNGSDYLAWRDLVATGQLAAVVRDMPPLQWLASNAPLCEVTVLSQDIEPFDYGVAFHANTSSALVAAWSSTILRMQEDGTLQQLKESWIYDPTSGCQAQGQVARDQSAVSFQDLSGLWIIAGAGAAAGCLIMAGERMARKRQKQGGRRRRPPALEGGRRPRRLVSMARLVSRRGTRQGWEAGQVPGGVKDETLEPELAGSGTKPADWDLESQDFGSRESSGRPVPGGPAPPPAAAPLPPPAAAAPAGAARAGLARVSALQTTESIYAAYAWKSKMRQGAKKG